MCWGIHDRHKRNPLLTWCWLPKILGKIKAVAKENLGKNWWRSGEESAFWGYWEDRDEPKLTKNTCGKDMSDYFINGFRYFLEYFCHSLVPLLDFRYPFKFCLEDQGISSMWESWGLMWTPLENTNKALFYPCNIPNNTCHNTYSRRRLHYHPCGLL